MAAWEQQAWHGVSVQVDEGTHRPQSLSASLPEAVLPAEMPPAAQLPVAATKQDIGISSLILEFKLGEDKTCMIIKKHSNIIRGCKQEESRGPCLMRLTQHVCVVTLAAWQRKRQQRRHCVNCGNILSPDTKKHRLCLHAWTDRVMLYN